MKPTAVLSVFTGILIIACTSASQTEVTPTPNIDATVEARVKLAKPTPNIEATVEARLKLLVADQEAPSPNPTPIPSYTAPANATKTATPRPTYTALPTYTPHPTYTPSPPIAPTPVLSPTHTPVPIPTPTLLPTPTPVPLPLLEAFSGTLHPSITMGSMVHSFAWSLTNNYRETVTLVTASVSTADGKSVSEVTPDEITEIWGTGDIEPGQTFSVSSDFRIFFYTTTEVSEFESVWVIRTATQGIVRCTFKSSSISCV